MVSKDQSIIMQVAAKIASELTPKTNDMSSNIMAFSEAYDAVCEIILTSQGFGVPSATETVPPAPVADEQLLIQQSFPQATPLTSSSTATSFTVTIKGKQHGPIPEWLNDACAVKGVREVWDNRDTIAGNPKRPWFKSTTGNDAFWAPRGN
jgi:hypothetical protein